MKVPCVGSAVDTAISLRLSSSGNPGTRSGVLHCGVPFLSPHVRPGDLVEISGPSGAGKTQILYGIVAHLLLLHPSCVVYWFGCNGGFNGGRLVQVVEGVGEVNGWKERVVVMHAWSSVELMGGLSGLEDLSRSRRGRLTVVVIDGFGVWHWAERLDRGGKARDCVESAVVTVLRNLLKGGSVVAFCTKADLVGERLLGGSGKDVRRWLEAGEYMPPAWTSLVAHRIIVNERYEERHAIALLNERRDSRDKSMTESSFAINDGGITFG